MNNTTINVISYGACFYLGSLFAAIGFNIFTWQFWVGAPVYIVIGILSGAAKR